MAEVERIAPEAARRDVLAGKALLVCGYEDEEKCQKMLLEGSISMQEFQSMAHSVPKDREIIFYCA